MSTELYWLVLTALMTGLLWIPYIINRIMELGPPPTNRYPLPDPPPKAQWAARAVRAHMNAVENLVVFAPLAFAIQITNSGTHTTAIACMVYFYARAAHYAISIFGLPIPFRTVAFLVGVFAQVSLALTLLGFL
jgi:uncharacterized MAPEG superfamily protein